VFVSAATGEGTDRLLARIADALRAQMVPIDAVVPYDKAELVARARTTGDVQERYLQAGVRIRGHLPEGVAAEVTAAGAARDGHARRRAPA
jgi:GTP-binding protein HflX